MDWLNKFHKEIVKSADYADKTLASYKLGMKAKGSIAGVRIIIDPNCCDACRALSPTAIHHPDTAPRLPLTDCTKGQNCQCVYRPVMTYEVDENGNLKTDVR